MNLVLLGDKGVGKTNILSNYICEVFSEKYYESKLCEITNMKIENRYCKI
jgi:GTPase SAR1 family protein